MRNQGSRSPLAIPFPPPSYSTPYYRLKTTKNVLQARVSKVRTLILTILLTSHQFYSILTFVVPLVSALTLQIPKNPTTGGQTTITWTANATDPASFTLELLQASFHNAIGIANNVPTASLSLTLELPSVPPTYVIVLQRSRYGRNLSLISCL